ncbi:MAG: hypothetical protein NT014_05555 [Candidatus Omnitrophica bacterium]|nr:hypothetical protein [Candidatus Omnitrophota bacterium]
MKNRELIILFVIFTIVILASLFITQLSQKSVSLSEKEITVIEQAENEASSIYPLQASPAPIAALPLAKSGITITNQAPASVNPEEKTTRAPKTVVEAVSNVSGLDVTSDTSTVIEGSLQTGITKTGKRPTPKETQEMNSSGIVMY